MSDPLLNHDTIAAVATAPGRGAIGIIRISGPEALAIAARLFRGPQDPKEMAAGRMAHGYLEAEGIRLDEVLCLVMRAPKSYTGEDVVEFHCHGGPIPLRLVLSAVLREGARPAAPGEFTRRAFLAGRLDLAQAEAVADLIASETELAARAALAQLEGGLSHELGALRRKLAEQMARLEAAIDFADEEDVPADLPAELAGALRAAEDELGRLIEKAEQGRRFREGARVVIAGRPNVGKSTLMNALLRADRVIVTDSPGTTRDVVEDMIVLGQIPIRLFDTAGLREGGSAAERIGVTRARDIIATADLVLFMLDGSVSLSSEDRALISEVKSPCRLVVNKSDLPAVVTAKEIEELATRPALRVSALRGDGLSELEKAMADQLLAGASSQETPLITNLRHAQALQSARASLQRAWLAHQQGLSPEFIVSDLRLALEALGRITGETATEEILDIIFSRFCVGK